MLSISDIKKHSFAYQKGGKFYESVEVDSFFSNVTETLDTLTAAYEKAKRENDELIRKISVLSEKIEEYRKDEDNIRSALLIAQRASESVLNDAKGEAEKLVSSAKEHAASVIASADDYVRDKTDEINKYHESAKTDYEARIKEAESKADAIIDEAQKKGEEIVTKAKAEASGYTSYADNKVAIDQKKILSMKKIVSDFKSSVIDIMNQQIRLLESIDVEEIDLSEVDIDADDVDEVYHPEYTSEVYNAEEEPVEAEEAADDEPAEEDTAEAYEEEEAAIDDVSSEIEEIEEISIDPDYDDDDKDYFDSLMEDISAEAEEKKQEKKNVFTPISESGEQLSRRNDEAGSAKGEDLKFGKDYDIFEGDDDSQSTFFGRFKKK